MLQVDLLKGLKVLVVEDEKNIADLLKDAISEYFQAFEIAYDGKEALLKFRSFRPDIIITDIMIPKLTGLELAQEIKKYADTPIVVLSAYSDTQKLLKAIDIGVVKYFIKPFDPDELLEYLITLAQKIQKERVVALKGGFVFQEKLYKDGQIVSLTPKEIKFIKTLLEKRSKIISHTEIKELLWQDTSVSDERVRTFIRRLRAKTSKDLIGSISRQGYFLNFA